MASYQSRQREPLLDSNTHAVLEKRGRELVGFVLVLLGLMAFALIYSYSPDDPSWISATDAPVSNWLGTFGAMIAAPVFMIIGYGALVVGVVFFAWGVRCVLHIGSDRAASRLILFPLAIVVASVYASTLVPASGWKHSFGLGGLLGDTLVAIILNIFPFSVGFSLKLLSLLTGIGFVAALAFVTGFTRDELRSAWQFCLRGLVQSYAAIVSMLGLGALGAGKVARGMRERYDARREQSAASNDQHQYGYEPQRVDPAVSARVAEVIRQEPVVDWHRVEPSVSQEQHAPIYQDIPQPEPKPNFLSALMKRPVQPELVENSFDADIDQPDDARIRSKIADVIKSRVRGAPIGINRDAPQNHAAPRITGAQKIIAPPFRAEPQFSDQTLHQGEEFSSFDNEVIDDDYDEHNLSHDADANFAFGDDQNDDQSGNIFAAGDASEFSHVQPTTVPQFAPRRVVQQPQRKPITPSKQARAEAQPGLAFDASEKEKYETPPLSLLMSPDKVERHVLSDEALEQNARMLENVLDDYGVKGEIVSVRPGPVVTMYELEPAPGLKASRVIGLADDIARSMSALSARVSTVPGRSVIGIELPNEKREMVALREILSGKGFGDSNMRLPLALGKDIGGEPIVANLAKMPHLLIAGTTGSGKSVAINTMILSLLYRLSPEECRMIMIDPKMLELSVYDGIPHLLSPVVTDPKKAVVALKWVVGEMEERYRKMSKMGVRNIDGYNSRVRDALDKGETFNRTVQTGFDDDTGEPVFESEEIIPEVLPFIVVVVDEMADLMMVAGKEIEACIQRLAQMARASGIHLIMATQRPSVDVITGTIKANFPTRISFQVTSKIDSRTILGEQGAEQLLGMGDMLYMAGGSKITRIHGPFCSDEEVEEVVNNLKAWGPPEYVGGVVDGPEGDKADNIDAVLGLGGNTDGEDALYDQAVAIVIKDRKCSTSYIQRKLSIGYNKAAKLVEQMEEEGLVSPANHVGKRDILIPEQAS